MKRMLFGLIVLGTLWLVSGCSDGIADTRRDRQERWKRILENDFKQLNDDLDSFMLMDQPSRLSPWQIE